MTSSTNRRQLGFSVGHEMYAVIKARADAEGMAVGAYCRYLCELPFTDTPVKNRKAAYAADIGEPCRVIEADPAYVVPRRSLKRVLLPVEAVAPASVYATNPVGDPLRYTAPLKEITDADIEEMAKRGLSDTYIVGHHRLKMARVAAVTKPYRHATRTTKV